MRSTVCRKQRALSRSWRESKSRGKKQALARTRERMAEARRQELQRLADRIVRTYEFIALEALKIRNMLSGGKGKRGLNRAIAEQGWREFLDILKGKAESAGIPLVEVPPSGTSQDCSRYGTKVPKALSERMHRCGVCGLELDRDENAATNVLHRGLCIFGAAVAVGGTAQGAPAASTARQMEEQKTRRLGSTEGNSREQNRRDLVRFLRAGLLQVHQVGQNEIPMKLVWRC